MVIIRPVLIAQLTPLWCALRNGKKRYLTTIKSDNAMTSFSYKQALLGGVAVAAVVTVASLLYIFQTARPTIMADAGLAEPPSMSQPAMANTASPTMKTTAPVAPANAGLASAALTVEEMLRLPDLNPDYATFGDRVSEIRARRNGQDTDVAALYASSQKTAAWQSVDSVSDEVPLTDEERFDGREFIQIDPLKIESLVPGDTLEIEIAQNNARYQARIDRVEVQLENNVTWFGHLENVAGAENDTNVVFTRGTSLLTAGITTPNGHFELEARNGEGWIASSATLFKEVDTVMEVPKDELAKSPSVSKEALTQKPEGIQFAKNNDKGSRHE